MSFFNSKREWSENPRLRFGIVFIVVLGWAYGLLVIDEVISKRRDEIALRDQEVSQLVTQAHSQEWVKVRNQAVSRLSEFRTRVWREESEGRIQAAFQDWLSGQLAERQLNASEMTVTLLTPTTVLGEKSDVQLLAGLPPEMRVARARMVMDFRPRAFAELISAIAANKHWLWIERLAIRNWGSPRVELELGALFAIGSKEKP